MTKKELGRLTLIIQEPINIGSEKVVVCTQKLSEDDSHSFLITLSPRADGLYEVHADKDLPEHLVLAFCEMLPLDCPTIYPQTLLDAAFHMAAAVDRFEEEVSSFKSKSTNPN